MRGQNNPQVRSHFFVGLLTMLIDFLFHTLASSPQETPLYFFAKFSLATLTDFLPLGSKLTRAVFGGVIFTALTGVYYFAAAYFANPILSCCFVQAPAVYGVPYQVYFVLGNFQVSDWLLIFAGVHFLAFFIASLLVKR